jgi:uncharacterized protein YyaL (SSP411 family)
MPFVFEFLWRGYKRAKDERFRNTVLVTLTRISQGGIYDHLGGGFARYSTDAEWLVPHFEKMLYDNAQLIDLLTLVWQQERSPLFGARVRETIDWLTREMVGENGAFTASLDADSEGEEGKFYVWTEGEIDAVLGAEAAFFKQNYDVTPGGNWEGHTILNRTAAANALLDGATEQRLAAARTILLAARAKRIRPGRDDKILADWNGLAIAALARAGAAFAHPEWSALAAKVFDAIRDTMTWTDESGRRRLGHSLCGGRLQRTAMLDDYANMANAAIALHETQGGKGYIAQAEEWIEIANALYWDDDGGYFFTATDAKGLIVRTKTATDSAVPSGNGSMAFALARLFYITGKQTYRMRAASTIEALGVEALKSFPHGTTLLNAYELLESAVQVVVIGDRNARETAALESAVRGASVPNLVFDVIPDDSALPEIHPARGKVRLNGSPTAYVCRGPTCSPPQTSVEGLRQALEA